MLIPRLHAVLACEPEIHVQLGVLLGFSLFWYITIPMAGRILVKPYIDSKPWKTQFIEIQQKTMSKAFGVDFDTDSCYEFVCESIPMFCQHGIGGALCIPAVLGIGSPGLRTAMACHGALCEAGWEFQDLLRIIGTWLFGTEHQKALKPPALCVILIIHHAMGLTMVTPMNLCFPGFYYYHEGIFLLQFAAFFASFFQFYGYTLDTSTPSGLCQMLGCVALVLLVIGWSRGFRYAVVAAHVLGFLYSEGNTGMFIGACVAVTCMSLLNLMMLSDAMGKFTKFASLAMKSDASEDHHVLLRQASFDSLRSASHESLHEVFSPKAKWLKLRSAVRAGLKLRSAVRTGTLRKED